MNESLTQNTEKESKQSTSIDDNSTQDALKISKQGMMEVLSVFNYDPHHFENALNNVNDKTDIFEIKEWLDNNVDILAADVHTDEAKDDAKEEKCTLSNENMIKFPVQVFVRLRPLIKEEIELKHHEIEYDSKYIKKTKSTTININDITARTNVRKSAINKADQSNNKIAIKKFKGFKSILSAAHNNHETFKQSILPSVDNIFKGYTVCSFAYGHTGSGKTHTILGYDENVSPGMYRLTAKYINDKLEEMNKTIDNEEDKVLLSCRFAELYQGKMRDLFGNLVECHVREDDKGNINIRGPTLKDEETGQVKVQPLTPVYIRNGETNKLINKVNQVLKFRKHDSSAVHDESSRSHVFLEMELVTNKLVEKRTDLWNAEGELVPIGMARDGFLVEAARTYVQDPETNCWVKNKDYLQPQEIKERVGKAFLIASVKVKKCEEIIQEVMDMSHKCIGGTMVFVDLAGNEWGSDSKNIKNDNNVQLKERKEINKSLLSLKECVRALHVHKGHVPYRDSKLTMVLRPHLRAINSTAIMIANISPSQAHIKKTYNTLKYAQLVAKA